MRDFVKICLAKDPKERPTVDDLLTHPFITKMDYQRNKLDFMDLLRKY